MIFFLVVFLVVLALTAPRWGTDTRDGRDWQQDPNTEVRLTP